MFDMLLRDALAGDVFSQELECHWVREGYKAYLGRSDASGGGRKTTQVPNRAVELAPTHVIRH